MVIDRKKLFIQILSVIGFALSVKLAMINIASASHFVYPGIMSTNMKNTKKGTIIDLNIVSLFGRFIIDPPIKIIFRGSRHHGCHHRP